MLEGATSGTARKSIGSLHWARKAVNTRTINTQRSLHCLTERQRFLAFTERAHAKRRGRERIKESKRKKESERKKGK